MSSIWETLSKIDVSEHTEEKNGLTYLSWAWAWGKVKDSYPQARYVKRIWTIQTGLTVACRTHETGTAGPMSW